jgi:alpha-galactosidase
MIPTAYNKNSLVLLFILLFGQLTYAQTTAKKDFHSWAPTAPMGWNSWDCYGPNVTEAEVKANADYMAKNLKQYGWNYIVVDIRWYVANDKSHGYNETDPQYNIDSFGRFMPAINRFPSSAGGKGFKPLADYLHSKGLKFGIHIMRGIPVIAVKNKMRIYGTDRSAADIFSDSIQCPWLHDMYTVLAAKRGAQEYYNSIISLYAAWGVDFIKCDDLSRPYHKAEIEMLRKAIDKCGRRIVLSTSPGETPITEGKHVQAYANMWRTIDDFWDNWRELKAHFDIFARWNQYRIDGAYPDGDMLPLGHLGIKAERGVDRMSLLTKDEQYTVMTLWCIFKSPLMFGGDLPGNDAFTLSLLTNKEVLHILKYSTHNRQVYNADNKVAWIADDPATGDKYIALFNVSDTIQTLSISIIKELGIKGDYTSKDLWTGKKEKGTAQQLSVAVNPHGTVLYKVSKQK